jgi:hypothetical protein
MATRQSLQPRVRVEFQLRRALGRLPRVRVRTRGVTTRAASSTLWRKPIMPPGRGCRRVAATAAGLACPDRPETVGEEICWQLDDMSTVVRAALRQLPPVGESIRSSRARASRVVPTRVDHPRSPGRLDERSIRASRWIEDVRQSFDTLAPGSGSGSRPISQRGLPLHRIFRNERCRHRPDTTHNQAPDRPGPTEPGPLGRRTAARSRSCVTTPPRPSKCS